MLPVLLLGLSKRDFWSNVKIRSRGYDLSRAIRLILFEVLDES